VQDFKHIRAWQRAHALAIALHKLTRGFSQAGYAHLKAQITRSADSISTNIVEGCGSATNKEFARFLDISIKSANETEHHLLSARDLDLVSPTDWQSAPPKPSRFGRWFTPTVRSSCRATSARRSLAPSYRGVAHVCHLEAEASMLVSLSTSRSQILQPPRHALRQAWTA